jgi:tartrate-resistant acid phosphatase type 5
VSEEVRGPYSQSVYGFTHLEIAAGQLVLRHFDANGKLLHGFRKLPDFSFAPI